MAIAIDRTCSRNHYRAENLCYRFEHGQRLLPQFRKIVCLVGAPLAQADKRKLIQGILIHGMCIFRVRAATAARNWSAEHCSNGVAVIATARMSFRGAKRRGNPLNRNATQWRLPLTALVLAITTAQKIFAISSSRGKDSCHNSARLSAW